MTVEENSIVTIQNSVINKAIDFIFDNIDNAWRLKVEKDKSITEIGVDYGYSSSNFATAFKRHLNITPANFRNVSEQLAEQCSFSHGISIDELVDTENLITVEELDSFFVLYERKKGKYKILP